MTHTVILKFDGIDAKNPLEAAKIIAGWCSDGAMAFAYDVTDESTGKQFSVDLSEEDEDAVLEVKE